MNKTTSQVNKFESVCKEKEKETEKEKEKENEKFSFNHGDANGNNGQNNNDGDNVNGYLNMEQLIIKVLTAAGHGQEIINQVLDLKNDPCLSSTASEHFVKNKRERKYIHECLKGTFVEKDISEKIRFADSDAKLSKTLEEISKIKIKIQELENQKRMAKSAIEANDIALAIQAEQAKKPRVVMIHLADVESVSPFVHAVDPKHLPVPSFAYGILVNLIYDNNNNLSLGSKSGSGSGPAPKPKAVENEFLWQMAYLFHGSFFLTNKTHFHKSTCEFWSQNLGALCRSYASAKEPVSQMKEFVQKVKYYDMITDAKYQVFDGGVGLDSASISSYLTMAKSQVYSQSQDQKQTVNIATNDNLFFMTNIQIDHKNTSQKFVSPVPSVLMVPPETQLHQKIIAKDLSLINTDNNIVWPQLARAGNTETMTEEHWIRFSPSENVDGFRTEIAPTPKIAKDYPLANFNDFDGMPIYYNFYDSQFVSSWSLSAIGSRWFKTNIKKRIKKLSTDLFALSTSPYGHSNVNAISTDTEFEINAEICRLESQTFMEMSERAEKFCDYLLGQWGMAHDHHPVFDICAMATKVYLKLIHSHGSTEFPFEDIATKYNVNAIPKPLFLR